MLCVEAPEANILVCKGYNCTKNQAPNYMLLQNQVISSSNCLELLRSQQQSSHGNRSSYNKLRLIQQTHSIQAHTSAVSPLLLHMKNIHKLSS